MDKQRLKDLISQVSVEMKDESDRAVIVVGAARLDSLLSELLNSFMIPCSVEDYEMFKDRTPVSSFHSKIVLAQRCGLISLKFAKALRFVKKIRNNFAHKPIPERLDAGKHYDYLKKIENLFPHGKDITRIAKIMYETRSSPSDSFRLFVVLMIVGLAANIERIVPTQPQYIDIFDLKAVGETLRSEDNDALQP